MSEVGVGERVPRVMLAEDDFELRRLLAGALRRGGCDVVEVRDGLQLRERLSSSSPLFDNAFDLIVSDVRMPGLTGFEALSNPGRGAPLPPVILITAFGDQQTYLQAARFGAVAFFDKPIDIDRFCEFVTDLLRSGRRDGDPEDES